MCFSTEASFGASTVLAIVGIATLTKVKTRSQIPYACIPLIFALQQFTEGFVWLSLLTPEKFTHPQIPTYLFLIIAQIVWPTWVPFSILCLEKDKKRRKIISALLAIGICFSVYLTFSMLNYPTHSEMQHFHIRYEQQVPHLLILIGAVFYFMSTVIPPFISKDKNIKALGFIIFISFMVSKLFFADNVVSVWCFFAAILSIIVYVVIKRLNANTII